MDEQAIIDELRRVAAKLQSTGVTRKQFRKHGKVAASTVADRFGTWNKAVEAAGLTPYPSGRSPDQYLEAYSDEELLQEIIRLTLELGKRPTVNEMNAKGRFRESIFRKRWGLWSYACDLAYTRYGFPQPQESGETEAGKEPQLEPPPEVSNVIIPKTHRPPEALPRKKVLFGEAMDFRGLRFAPTSEHGVIYLFGMIHRELGFIIESIRTGYPVCEGKRCVDPDDPRGWEHVYIEFEYRSSDFREHGHSPLDCDLIVCWIHDWEQCPIEVLELSSQIDFLPNR